MARKIWTIIPFARALRDLSRAFGIEISRTPSQLEEDAAEQDPKSQRLRDRFLALRTPLETVRAKETRLPDDKPISCIVPIQHLSRGAPTKSEERKMLTTRYGCILAGCLDLIERNGLSNKEAEGYLTEVLRAKGLWPIQIGFLAAEQKRSEYFETHSLQAPTEKRKALRDRNGRLDLGKTDKEAVEELCRLLRILHIALQRADDLDLGRNSLESKNIKKGRFPTVKRIGEKLLGSENAQRAQRLCPSDILHVAIQGHVNPSHLWLDLLVYEDIFDVAVFMGRAVAGHRVECDPDIAATYLTDVKRSWSRKPCDPRAVQDRDWYARELRECLNKPAYTLARTRLEHAVATIPECVMRRTIPLSSEGKLYALVHGYGAPAPALE